VGVSTCCPDLSCVRVCFLFSVEGLLFHCGGFAVSVLEVLLFSLWCSCCLNLWTTSFGGLYFGKTVPQSILTEIKP
jgi:hypothetical protein